MTIDSVHYNLPSAAPPSLATKLPKGSLIDQLTPAGYLYSAYYIAAAYAASDFTQNRYFAIPFMMGGFLSFYKTLSRLEEDDIPAAGKGA